jgi:transcriptional regulator
MNPAELLRLLEDLAARHERGAPRPWQPSDLGAELREKLTQQIVGLAVVVERVEGKFKLSQNRTAVDRDRVVRALEERGHPDDLEMARLMTARGSGG